MYNFFFNFKFYPHSSYLIFLICFFHSFESSAEDKHNQFIIREIKIISQNKKLNSKLLQKIHSYKGKVYTENLSSQIEQSISKYLLSNRYRNSQIKKWIDQKQTLFYKIEHPYQYHFIMMGNEKIHTLNLYKILKSDNLFYQIHFIEVILNKIKIYYKSLFFNNVEIKFEITEYPNKFLNIIKIKIKEGAPSVIGKISISNTSFKKKRFYMKLFRLYSTPNLKKGYFVKKDFQKTINKIITHIRQLGYYHAQIYDTHIKFKKNKTFVQVLIDEGQPIMIGRIEIKGQKYFSKSKIKKILNLKPKTKVNILKLEKKLNNLIEFYHENGFLFAQIKNKNQIIQFKDTSKPAVVTIHIHEGEKSYVKDIQVRGNKKIKSSFIAHASSLKKGELLNKKKLNQAYDFINDSGLFSTIHIHPSSIIDVKEQEFRFIRTRGGISSENSFSIRGLFDGGIKRFLGDDGSLIAFNTELKTNIKLLNYFKKDQLFSLYDLLEYRIMGNYQKQYLFNTRFNWHSSYSFSRMVFAFPKTNSLQPNTLKEGVKWSLSQKINFNLERKFDLNTILNFKILEIEWIKSYTPKTSSNELNRRTQRIHTIGLFTFIDRRDNIFFPKKGYQFSSSLDYSDPFIGSSPSIHFLKATAKQTFYIPLIKNKLIWAWSFSGGFIQLMKSAGVPYKYSFILGGFNNLRGFDGRSDGDRIPSKEELPINDVDEIIYHPSTFYLIKSEIRFPLIKNFIGGALFYDRGGVYMKHSRFKESHGHSTGFSIHFSPLGPFIANINIAFKLNKLVEKNINPIINFSMGAF